MIESDYMRINFGFFLVCFTLPLYLGSSPASPSALTARKPVRNVILMIGDGMGASQITAGLVAKRNKLQLERCKHMGLVKTFADDNLITDSAAGATAFACGKKTFNGAIAVDPRSKKPLKTILEIAHEQGKHTGLLATSYIQHATPAAFYAHVPNRALYEDISLDFFSGTVDIAIGGGRKFFDKRKDDKALLDTLVAKGYEYFPNLKQACKTNDDVDRLVVLANKEHLPSVANGRGKFLPKAAEFITERLNQHAPGFFLMIEGSQIDWGGHANDKDYIINEMKDFDRTVGKVLDFAETEGNTLVIITADHETGGFALEGGDLVTGSVSADFTTGGHSGTMVPIFAYGPGAEAFGGIQDNTDIFYRMMSAFGFSASK